LAQALAVPGMDADFVALSEDPVDAAPAALVNARMVATVVAGAEVFRG
jgi:predicted amidohydrolase YtcJ